MGLAMRGKVLLLLLLAAGAAHAADPEPPASAHALAGQAQGWVMYGLGLGEVPVGLMRNAAARGQQQVRHALDDACPLDCLPLPSAPGLDATGRIQAATRDGGQLVSDEASAAGRGSPAGLCWPLRWYLGAPGPLCEGWP